MIQRNRGTIAGVGDGSTKGERRTTEGASEEERRCRGAGGRAAGRAARQIRAAIEELQRGRREDEAVN